MRTWWPTAAVPCPVVWPDNEPEEEGSELEPGPYRNEWLGWLHAVPTSTVLCVCT